MIQGLKQDLIKYLGNPKNLGDNQSIYHCPFCKHRKKKLQIHLDLGQWHCWVCGKKGRSFYTLFKSLNATHDILDKYRNTKRTSTTELTFINGPSKLVLDKDRRALTLPEEFKPLYIRNTEFSYKQALRYVLDRGITIQDILKYNIGYCSSGPYKNMIIVPSYDSFGILNYFVGRSFVETEFNHKNPKVSKDIIGFELYINWKLPIYIVEGVFDAISIKRNAIPLFGKYILPKLKEAIITNKVKDIYICLDSDVAKKQILSICEYFKSNGINVHNVKLDKKDPNEIGFFEMIKILKNTKKFDFNDLIRLKLQI